MRLNNKYYAFLFGFFFFTSQAISFYFPDLPGAGSIFILFILPFVLKLPKSKEIKNVLAILAILIVIFTVSLIWTNAPNYGMLKIFQFIIFWVLPLTGISNLIKNENHISYLINGFFYGFVLYFLFVLNEIGNPLNVFVSRFIRISISEEVSPVIYTRYMAIGIIFCYYKFWNENNILIKLVSVLLALVSLFYMILSGSKGPLLSLLFVLVVNISIIIIIRKEQFLSYSFIIIFLAIIIFFSNFIFDRLPLDFINERFAGFNISLLLDTGSYISREYQNMIAIDNVNISNIMQGTGIGNYGYLFFGRDLRMYPHNIFIEILYENGLIGLTLLLISLVYITIYFIKNYFKLRNKLTNYIRITSLFLSLFIFSLIVSQVTADLPMNYFIIIFAAVLIKTIELSNYKYL